MATTSESLAKNERAVRRGYVKTSKGQIHYRVAGEGKPLFLLHPSPFNSKRFISLLPALGARRRVFALDTPGYGQSYRPESQPSIAHYADAVAEAIGGLGYDRAPLYGDLSGAIIAIATAARYPQTVSALALGVIPYFAGNLEEATPWRKNYSVGYHLGDIPEDGSHFIGLFRRIIDAGLHKPHPDHVNSPEQLTEWVIERMQMRDSAIWGFEAVFNCDLDAEIRNLDCPVLLASTEAHGNEVQIARARSMLKSFELVQGPRSFFIEETRDFLAEVIPNFLESRGL